MGLISVDRTERVVWITLERPPLNILNLDMLHELGKAIEKVDHSASVVVFGAVAGSRAFSAGIDISNYETKAHRELLWVFHGVLRQILKLRQVTVAAVDGSALGGGFELALACDLLVASHRAELGFPEIKLGCFPPAAVAALPALCGRAVASDLILSGHAISAARAAEVGLVSRLCSANRFDEELQYLVSQLSAHSPAVLQLTARLTRERFVSEFERQLSAAEGAYERELLPLPDMREGFVAFLEKRTPKWGE